MQTSFADEIRGTAARLIAYVVAPALLAILGSALWDWLPAAMDGACARARIIQPDSSDKTVVYEIFRPALGGRWDVFRWTDADRRTSPIS